jgi:PEGA domain
MANSESTAVNELIDLLGNKPLVRDSEPDLFAVVPTPPDLFAEPVAPTLPVTPRRPARGTTPPAPDVFAEPVALIPPLTPLRPARGTTPPRVSSHTARAMPVPTIHRGPEPVRSVAIPAAPRRPSRPSNHSDDNITHAVVLAPPVVVSRLILPMALLTIGGVFIGGFIAFNGEGGQHHAAASIAPPAPVVAASPAPVVASPPAVIAALPTVAPPPTIVPEPIVTSMAPALTEVLLETQPAGATVMMVDRGTSSPVGMTPIRISLDHELDLVFTLDGHVTRVEHLDPHAHNRLAITLEDSAPAPVAPVVHHHTAVAVARTAPIAVRAGSGVLMISSKPPCAIFVDGRATGLTTPQRSMTLPAGNHQITLVNKERNIKKTVPVQITTDKTTKLTRDLMKS